MNIKTNNKNYVLWKKRRDTKVHKLNVKKKKWRKERRKQISTKKIDRSVKYLERDYLPDKFINVPKHFSIINNPNDTISFFDQLIELIYSKVKQKIYMNMKNVEVITVDALIYLLAVIKNMRARGMVHKNPIRGNYPDNKEAFAVFVRSGFLDYMNNGVEKIDSKDISRIYYGSNYDQNISKKMCIFAHEHSALTIDDTDYLYNSICEMMLNTVQHAYESSSKLINNWYSYAECNENELIYMFFDTGEGIAKTIDRRMGFLGLSREKDSDLLSSALNGDFRTSTKLKTRGSGLVSIKNSVGSDMIKYLSVITNKASNVYEINDKIIVEKKNDMDGSLTGTLYYWKVRRVK